MKNMILFIITLLLSPVMAVTVSADNIVDSIGKNHPNDRFIPYKTTVVDTLEAERIFSEKKMHLMEAYQKGVAKRQRCEELIGMKGEKVNSEDDLQILKDAIYRQRLLLIPIYRPGIADSDSKPKSSLDKVYKLIKDIEKGKLTENVLCCLREYGTYLTDSLNQQQKEIDRGWSYWLDKNEIPHKEIVVTTKNKFYRGFNYDNYSILDTIEKKQQREGWDYLYSNNRTSKYDSYPQDLNYYVYDAAPQYKVLFNKDEIECVYDKEGKLVYVPSFTRENNSVELKDIKRAVYLNDYKNNKYGIKSQPAHTQEYLKLILGQDNGFEKAGIAVLGYTYGAAFVSMAASSLLSPLAAHQAQNKAKQKLLEEALKYKDSIGEKYIEQLKSDHSDEFGYVYMIERISNVSFRIVYINQNSLQPSHCAIVKYRTGDKPYTTEFNVTLTNIPSNIPPCK